MIFAIFFFEASADRLWLHMTRFSVSAEREARVYAVSDFLLNADIIIGKLAHFGIIDAKDLSLFGRAKAEARDEMHSPENDGCHGQRPAETGARVSELDTELPVIVVQPTSFDGGGTIESSNASLSEEASQYVSDDTANSVAGKDVEGIVVTKYEFELGGEIAQSASHKTEKHSSGSSDET